MRNFAITIPLSLYIHLPWCVRKCPYCDFNSHELSKTLPEDDYIDALCADLQEQLPRIWGRRFVSIFFGGGTPSLFSARGIGRILTEINNLVPFNADTEITLEANPGTNDGKNFLGFRSAGINRLSIGLQSLQDEKLKALGRIHDRENALQAVRTAQEAGFENFNLDLMHGLPGQTAADALSDLRDALALNPTHLSWYQLTIEPNTFFHHQPPVLPVEDVLADIQTEGQALLAAHGFQQYETSAYCLPDRECAHNVNYWEFGDYLGIGAGAHSKITDVENKIITRHWQVKNPKDFLDKNKKFTGEELVVNEKESVFEFMLNALRLTQGVPNNLFVERTGLPVATISALLAAAWQKGLLEKKAERMQPTELGQRFLNDLCEMFLPKHW
jgi:putative oxygen-independent coproporphyrinogen III oxidase